MLASGVECLVVPGVCVAHHAGAWIGREHTLEPFRRVGRAVGEDDHAGVNRVADPDAAAVVDADPGGAPQRVFRSAFRIGQSAIASEPSRIASVSR